MNIFDSIEEKDYIIIPITWMPSNFCEVSFTGWKNSMPSLEDPFLLDMIEMASETLNVFIRLHKKNFVFSQPLFGIKGDGSFYFNIGTLEKEEYERRMVMAD
jgi:hypothetical protein